MVKKFSYFTIFRFLTEGEQKCFDSGKPFKTFTHNIRSNKLVKDRRYQKVSTTSTHLLKVSLFSFPRLLPECHTCEDKKY